MASYPGRRIVPSSHCWSGPLCRCYIQVASSLVHQPWPFLAQYPASINCSLRDLGPWHFSFLVSPRSSHLFSQIFSNKGWFHPLYIIGVLVHQGPYIFLKAYLAGYDLGHLAISLVQSLNPKVDHFPNEGKKVFILCHNIISLVRKRLVTFIYNRAFC